jgi:hypothetical protein
MITPPEINFCKDDLVIYVCSHELRQYMKRSANTDIITRGIAERMPRFPYYYEPFLKATFGTTAEISVTAGEQV